MKKVKVSRMIGNVIKCELMALIPALLTAICYAYDEVGWYVRWSKELWKGMEHEFPCFHEYFQIFLENLGNAIPLFASIALAALIIAVFWTWREQKED